MCAHPLARIAEMGAGERTPTFLGALCHDDGDDDEVGHVVDIAVDIAVGLCSQSIWASVLFISNVLVWMFFLRV